MPDRDVPPGVDVNTPHPARVYDALLGGSYNFPADRQAAQRLLEAFPNAAMAAQVNRAFLQRAVGFLAGEAGIRQFIDLGSGLPTQDNVHTVAQRVNPDVRVVYVDYDPTARVHTRALLREEGAIANTTIIQEDLRQPDKILRNPELRHLVDRNQPVGILLVAILHFIRDAENPIGIVGRLVEAMAPGSYLVISHATSEARPDAQELVDEIYQDATSGVTLRSREQVEAFFAGLELVEPGLVTVAEWRPDSPPDEAALEAGRAGLAGVAGKSR